MVSRKDCNAIAKIVRDNTIVNGSLSFIEVKALVNELSDYFKSDNPRFDRDKFYKACYGKEGRSNVRTRYQTN